VRDISVPKTGKGSSIEGKCFKQALMLIEQLTTSKHIAVDRFYRTLYESLLDPRLVASSKHALYLNLLFRAMKSDMNVRRVKAFAKRMMQIVTLHQPPFICGVLYLLRELEATFPGLKSMIMDAEELTEDGREIWRDTSELPILSENHASDSGADITHSKRSRVGPKVYDGRKREPEFSSADRTCMWESVSLMLNLSSFVN